MSSCDPKGELGARISSAYSWINKVWMLWPRIGDGHGPARTVDATDVEDGARSVKVWQSASVRSSRYVPGNGRCCDQRQRMAAGARAVRRGRGNASPSREIAGDTADVRAARDRQVRTGLVAWRQAERQSQRPAPAVHVSAAVRDESGLESGAAPSASARAACSGLGVGSSSATPVRSGRSSGACRSSLSSCSGPFRCVPGWAIDADRATSFYLRFWSCCITSAAHSHR